LQTSYLKKNSNIIIADVAPRAIMPISAKKSNGFDICNKYLSSKNAINGNPIKEVRRTIIKTGFLKSFFIFCHISLCFYDFIIIAFLRHIRNGLQKSTPLFLPFASRFKKI
jgi:hypothetical protein